MLQKEVVVSFKLQGCYSLVTEDNNEKCGQSAYMEQDNCKPQIHTKCSCFILFKIVMCSARFRNENKLVFVLVVCYTCDRTVTPVYAKPFTHESPNALSCSFTVLEKKSAQTLIHDLYNLKQF
jgi:hypothetical protein